MVQPLPFCRSRGHPTLQGLVETLHLEPEFWVPEPSSCILFQEPQRAGRPRGLGCGLGVVWGLQVAGPKV